MELVSFAKHVIQNAAEKAASYRVGQAALRHLDRGLWVVEKCARWAVPPPLDLDDRPQPELVRPLPWVFFLAMLIALRITRESISLINLILGKPPLRSADVVTYIQSKRRYLRTLKYQGNRNLRARSGTGGEPWYSSIQALFEFTMCFRRSHNYGNNNTTQVSNNDEVLVVKRGKRPRDGAIPVSANENTMERLIEKMMVDLDADSDDDSNFTLTNATSLRSLRSDGTEDSEVEQDTTLENQNAIAESTSSSIASGNVGKHELSPSPIKSDVASSTPEKPHVAQSPKGKTQQETKTENGIEAVEDKQSNKADLSEPLNSNTNKNAPQNSSLEESPKKMEKSSPKEDTKSFLQSERCSPQKQPSKHTKFGTKLAKAFNIFSRKHERIESLANGRTMSVPGNKKKGLNQRRDSDNPVTKISSADDSF